MKITKKLILILTLMFALIFTACSNEKYVNENAKNQKHSQENNILDGSTMKNSTTKSKEKIIKIPKTKTLTNSNDLDKKENKSVKDKEKEKNVQAKTKANKENQKLVESHKNISNSKTTALKPKTNRHKTDKHKTDKPNTNKPKTDKPKTDKPKTNKPKTNKPKTDKPKTNKPKTDKPKTNKPKTDKPKTDKPKTDLNKPVNSEKELKNVIESSLLSYPDKVKINLDKNYDPDNWNKLNDLIKSMLSSNVNFNYGFNKWQWERTSNTLTLIPNYSMSKDKLKAQNAAINKKVDEIIHNTIKSTMTELQKEKAIHDYLVNNTKYNYNNFKNQIYDPNDHSAYGPLILGTGVCEGYAKAMNLLLNKIGIESFMVTGLGNGGPHAWNIVKIDGNYYNVDATFDDPISSMGDILRYTYFNKSDRAISPSHSRDELGNKLPKCTNTKYDKYLDKDWQK